MAIPEDIIAVSFPEVVPDPACCRLDYMTSLDLLRQVVYLRRLQGIILRDVYLSPTGVEDPEDVSSRVRNDIDEWYESLPRAANGRPHPYLDANYHLLLVRLYSPSPLIRQTPAASMGVLRNSAYRLMELYGSTDQEYRIQRNHITLAHLAFACVALVYTLIETESTPANLKLVSWRRKALAQLDSAEVLLAGFSFQSVHAMANVRAFAKLTSDAKKRIGEVPPVPPPVQPSWSGPGSSVSVSGTARNGSVNANGTANGNGGGVVGGGNGSGSGIALGHGAAVNNNINSQVMAPTPTPPMPTLTPSSTTSGSSTVPSSANPMDNSALANLFGDGFFNNATPNGPLGWENWPGMVGSPWGGNGMTTSAADGGMVSGSGGQMTDIERFLAEFGQGNTPAGS